MSQAEAIALRDELRYAIKKGYKKVKIEGDSLLVINCLKQISDIPWRLLTIFTDIFKFIQDCEEIRVCHIYIEANQVADCIAKFDISRGDYS